MTLIESFRLAVAPHLTEAELRCLLDAAERDDPALVQDKTTSPTLYEGGGCRPDATCEGACALGYVAWKTRGLTTVGEVRVAFREMVERMPDSVGQFLAVFDTRPRPEVIADLKVALKEALNARATSQAA